ncbi:hypothetical protein L0F63_006412, partial [Massospora cicadina]
MSGADTHYEPAIDTDAAFPWGVQRCYIQVKPVSTQDCKKAKQSRRVAAKAVAMATSVIPPTQHQEDIKSFAVEAAHNSIHQSDWATQPEDPMGDSDMPGQCYQATIKIDLLTNFPTKFSQTCDGALEEHSNVKSHNKTGKKSNKNTPASK